MTLKIDAIKGGISLILSMNEGDQGYEEFKDYEMYMSLNVLQAEGLANLILDNVDESFNLWKHSALYFCNKNILINGKYWKNL